MKKPTAMPPKMKKPNAFIIFIFILLCISAAVAIFSPIGVQKPFKDVALSEVTREYTSGNLSSVTLDGISLYGENKAGERLKATVPYGTSLKDLGLLDVNNQATVEVKDNTFENNVKAFLSGLLPIVLIVLVLLFVLRQAQGNANSAFSFGQSKAKLHDKEKNKTTFSDVAGAEEAKEDLSDIVDFLKYPKKYTKMGAKIPKGVLLYGPPGTGKTLLARAVAGEADVPFYTISGSEFVEMFVGVGASRVRDLFKKAKRTSPSIIFIDEIDAVGRQRGAGVGGGHDEREQTLNQILTEMDGFEVDTNVIVMASTNRPDVLDPALLRPGRFDRRVIIDRPNFIERQQILEVHARKKPLEEGLNFIGIAKKIPGFTGADIENLLNESAILAVKKGLKIITLHEIHESIEKVSLGPQKKSSRLNDYEKKLTAYHELGHAVVGHMLPNTDPVHKVSVISRGMALGVTWFLPPEDIKLQSKAKFKDEICSLLGGRVAEEVFYGKENVTTGASNDLERASEIARKMVTEYGMSDEIGTMVVETRKNVFLGRDMGESKNFSNETAKKIDAAVNTILENAYTITKDIVESHKDLMDEMAKELLAKEELSEEEFTAYFVKHNITVPEKIGVSRAEGSIL